jgi:hypothetical protein
VTVPLIAELLELFIVRLLVPETETSPEIELVPEVVKLEEPYNLTTVPEPDPRVPPDKVLTPELPREEVRLST